MDDPAKFDVAPGRAEITAPAAGFVQSIDALGVGRAVLALGGGRERKGEAIDHGVGVEVLKKPGDAVQAGETVIRVYHRDGRGLDVARGLLEAGLSVGAQAPQAQPLILDRVN